MTWWHDQASRYPLLTPAQELSLGSQIRAWLDHPPPVPPAIERRGRRARERFIRANLRLVVLFAERYRSIPQQHHDDLIQAGNLGLMVAVEKFDPTRGYKFSTYAYWWIRQKINGFLQKHSRTITLPTTHQDRINRCSKVAAQLGHQLGRPATRAEIAAAMGQTVEQLDAILCRPAAVLSLDQPNPWRDDGAPIGESIPAPEGGSIEAAESLQLLALAVDRLPPQSRRIITSLWGLEGPPVSLSAVARAEGLQSSRVQRLADAALAALGRDVVGQTVKQLSEVVAEEYDQPTLPLML